MLKKGKEGELKKLRDIIIIAVLNNSDQKISIDNYQFFVQNNEEDYILWYKQLGTTISSQLELEFSFLKETKKGSNIEKLIKVLEDKGYIFSKREVNY